MIPGAPYTSEGPLTPGNHRDVLAPLLEVTGGELGRTLDIGANSTWLAQFVSDYTGIDTEKALVEMGRSYWVGKGRWTEEEARRRIVHANGNGAAKLPFPDGEFDTVVLRDVLEHVDDGLAFYREACRVLREGGHLLLSSPDNQSHVWNEPTHRRPYPISAQEYLAATARMTIVYRGYESVAPGTQRLARLSGGRTPWPVRLGWRLPFWPRNAVTVQRKGLPQPDRSIVKPLKSLGEINS